MFLVGCHPYLMPISPIFVRQLLLGLTPLITVVCLNILLSLWPGLGEYSLEDLNIGYGKQINANITQSVPSPGSSSSVSGGINSRQMAGPSNWHPTLLIYLFPTPQKLLLRWTNWRVGMKILNSSVSGCKFHIWLGEETIIQASQVAKSVC